MLPLEQQAIKNISEWLSKLTFPIRTGERSQAAFAFELMLDWSRVAGDGGKNLQNQCSPVNLVMINYGLRSKEPLAVFD